VIKQKLINKRISQKITQENMAFHLGITQSQYCRRENGVTKISKREWNKLANILQTSLYEIYEPEDGIFMSTEIESTQNNKYNLHLMELTIATLTKYIEKLEEENKMLNQKFLKKQSH
jgi:transcriptional regulator with XRE-family HTH domain